MKEIYHDLENPANSTHIYAKSGGKTRAKNVINKAFKKIYNGDFDISETKVVFLRITSGNEEITIDEIGEINDSIQNVLNNKVNIVMEVREDELDDEIEIQLIFTNLNLDVDNIDTSIVFNTSSPNVQSLPIYFLEDEYSSEEISEMISFLSDLYKDIGGDGLRIKGFSKVQVENIVNQPIFD